MPSARWTESCAWLRVRGLQGQAGWQATVRRNRLPIPTPSPYSGYLWPLHSHLILGSGRSPRGRHGNPLQYSYLQNPMDRGAWPAPVHGVTENPMTDCLTLSLFRTEIHSYSGTWGFQVALVLKNLPANAGDIRDVSSIPGSGRSPRGRHGNPFQFSSQENSMD